MPPPYCASARDARYATPIGSAAKVFQAASVSGTITSMRFICGAWLALIACVSLAPFKIKLLVRTFGPSHNAQHFLVFLAAGIMIFSTAKSAPARARRAMFLVLFCSFLELLEAVLYRTRIRWHEIYMRFEWHDVYIDVLALSCAWLGALLLDAFRNHWTRPATGDGARKLRFING